MVNLAPNLGNTFLARKKPRGLPPVPQPCRSRMMPPIKGGTGPTLLRPWAKGCARSNGLAAIFGAGNWRMLRQTATEAVS